MRRRGRRGMSGSLWTRLRLHDYANYDDNDANHHEYGVSNFERHLYINDNQHAIPGLWKRDLGERRAV